MAEFKVKIEGDDEWHPVQARNAADAVEEFCQYGDRNSWWADGYPDGMLVIVQPSEGTAKRYSVSTDWCPQFWYSEKEMTEFEREVLNSIGHGFSDRLEKGAAVNAAIEFLRCSGYIRSDGSLTDRGADMVGIS